MKGIKGEASTPSGQDIQLAEYFLFILSDTFRGRPIHILMNPEAPYQPEPFENVWFPAPRQPRTGKVVERMKGTMGIKK